MSDFAALINGDTGAPPPETLDEGIPQVQDTGTTPDETPENENPDETVAPDDGGLAGFLERTKFKSLEEAEKSFTHASQTIAQNGNELKQTRQMLYDALKGMQNQPQKPMEQATATEDDEVDKILEKLMENPKSTIRELFQEILNETNQEAATFATQKESLDNILAKNISEVYKSLTDAEVAEFEKWRQSMAFKVNYDQVNPELLKTAGMDSIAEYLTELLQTGLDAAIGRCASRKLATVTVEAQRQAKQSALRKGAAAVMQPGAKRSPTLESSTSRPRFIDLIAGARD